LKGSEPNYINYKIPTIPAIIEKKDSLMICITPLNFYRCNGFPETKLLDLNQIKTRFVRIFGGYLTNLSKTESDESFLYTEESGFGGVNKIANIQFVNSNYTQIYNRNLHGWMPVGTIFMLKVAIETYQPKVILELGSWLGRSTTIIVELYKRLKSSLKLISVDHFFNYFIRGKVAMTTIDRFYMNFDKYTTFHSNLSDVVNEKIKVFTMEGDVRNIIHEIKKNNERVEMVFIDSIKKSHELTETIEDIFRKYPDVIIVGDDYIHPTVMRGVRDAARKLRIKYIANMDSYIMTRRKLPNINDDKYTEMYESLVLKGKTSKYYDVINAINNKIDNEVILEMIKERELSMNQGIYINVSDLENYTMGDTLYHMITRLHRTIPKIFEEFEKPKKVYNMLFLTYLDYIEYLIEFQ
jgi:predicted O-methyltransferase YrrM